MTVPFEEYIGWQDTWMKRVVEFDSDNLKLIPSDDSVVLSNNGISHVVLHKPSNTIYKRSIPYLIENEIYWLEQMAELAIVGVVGKISFVPSGIQRFDKYTISMEYLGESKRVKNKDLFGEYWVRVKGALAHIRVRHGDLTSPNIIVRDDIPYILDWAESRFRNDPRPDKRPEGDSHWLQKTFAELCK